MHVIKHFLKKNYSELLFQAILLVVVFLFYAFDKNNAIKIEWLAIPFFINYAITAMLVNYILLPYLFYKKKKFTFIIATLLLCCITILIEEFFLEQIYYPNSRGLHFHGIHYSLLEILPFIIIFIGFKFAWDVNMKQKEVEELQSTIKEGELQFLKSQINPHFLFNNLNNLYSYAIDSSPKTPSIILELSAVLRYMLYDCKEDFVPLVKEINHLKSFTALNELQIEERGNIQLNVSSVPNNYNIAPLILMMFIENAFKHSTASQTDNIFIYTNIDIAKSGELTFNCKNSFLPNTNTESLSNGIGLENVKKRLRILYPNAHNLHINDSDNVYHVHLTIQLTPVT